MRGRAEDLFCRMKTVRAFDEQMLDSDIDVTPSIAKLSRRTTLDGWKLLLRVNLALVLI